MPEDKKLKVSSSPHIRAAEDTGSIMLDVIIALVPALAVSIYVFGLRALFITGVSVAACVFFEWGYRRLLKKDCTVGDLSAVVTGMLLAYCLPPGVPFWIPVAGAFFAIVVVKQLYGGIGKNFMNPALAARAFLFSWPVIMTTWTAPMKYNTLFNFGTDAVTAATPLGSLHFGTLPDYSLMDMFLGRIGGTIGEISALALLVGGVYLVFRRIITPRIPLSYILTVAVIALLFPKGGNGHVEWMLYNVFAGGVLLGAIFMATDYSTSPASPWGQIVHGVGCGLITMLIRYFGSYVEGVTYAILIMNTCAWLIDKSMLPRRFGTSSAGKRAAKRKKKEERIKAGKGEA